MATHACRFDATVLWGSGANDTTEGRLRETSWVACCLHNARAIGVAERFLGAGP